MKIKSTTAIARNIASRSNNCNNNNNYLNIEAGRRNENAHPNSNNINAESSALQARNGIINNNNNNNNNNLNYSLNEQRYGTIIPISRISEKYEGNLWLTLKEDINICMSVMEQQVELNKEWSDNDRRFWMINRLRAVGKKLGNKANLGQTRKVRTFQKRVQFMNKWLMFVEDKASDAFKRLEKISKNFTSFTFRLGNLALKTTETPTPEALSLIRSSTIRLHSNVVKLTEKAMYPDVKQLREDWHYYRKVWKNWWDLVFLGLSSKGTRKLLDKRRKLTTRKSA